ncbi:hypothetical protein Q3G72_009669 [Acer saccharum]|nr:hypothetical protein Q3G72_009669 [Acer saccharum]
MGSGSWNVRLLKESFLVANVDLILSIPPSSPYYEDSLRWHFEQIGVYSVCSNYRVDRMFAVNLSSSGLDDSISWWKALWCLTIPPKINFFMWCACHLWLPTLEYLARRGVPSDGLCPRCHHLSESMTHAL